MKVVTGACETNHSAAPESWEAEDISYQLSPMQGKKRGPWWAPVTLLRPYLVDETVSSLTALVLDLDDGTVSESDLLKRLHEMERWVYYTESYSSTWARPRWRVVMPAAEPYSGNNWPDLYTSAAEMIGLPWDVKCKNPSRLYFKPRHPPGAVRRCGVIDFPDRIDLHAIQPNEGSTESAKHRGFDALGAFSELTRVGERNDTLASVTGYLARHLPDLDVAAQASFAWSRVFCDPPEEREKVWVTIRSVIRKEQRRRGSL